MAHVLKGPVLFTTNTLGFFDGEVNGVAYTGQHLVRMFEEAGIETDVLTYGDRADVLRRGSVTIHVHDASRGLPIDPALKIDPFFAQGELARKIVSRRYEVVHTTTPDPLGWFSAEVARLSGAPLVAGYHTAVDEYLRRRIAPVYGGAAADAAAQAMAGFLSWFYNKADLVLATTPAMKRTLDSRLSTRVEILGRGVDSRVFSPSFRRPDRNGRTTALYVGRIAIEKGLHRLVPILRDRRDIELSIVGDGPARAEMQSLLPSASFTGVLTGDALSEAFADADLFVFPSSTDTFGNVILQAMASGLPCVVMAGPGPGEIVRDGETGLVARDERELKQAVEFLIANPDVRREMAAAALADSRRYRWSSIFETLTHLYGSLLATEGAYAA